MTKEVNRPSLFRSFLVSLITVLGAAIGLFVALFALMFLVYFAEDESLGSDVKTVADAEGNRKLLESDAAVILEIPLKGTIGMGGLTGDKIHELLLKSRESGLKKDRVKAVLLTINCPGGGVNDSDIIYRELLAYKARYNVPIYAYVDGLAASGGYYIACAADKIYSSPASVIGSIGVLSWPPFFNIVHLLEKIGVNTLTVIAGKDKDAMNPTRPWKSDEQKNHQEIIDYFYERFVAIVTSSRPISKDKLVNDYGAHVFSPPQALQDGFVDGCNMSRSDVLKALAKAAHIKEGTKYQVVEIATKGWLKKLFNEDSALWQGKVQHELTLPQELLFHVKNPYCYQ